MNVSLGRFLELLLLSTEQGMGWINTHESVLFFLNILSQVYQIQFKKQLLFWLIRSRGMIKREKNFIIFVFVI